MGQEPEVAHHRCKNEKSNKKCVDVVNEDEKMF